MELKELKIGESFVTTEPVRNEVMLKELSTRRLERKGKDMSQEFTNLDQDITDAKLYGDTAEAEVLLEIKRLGVENEEQPDICRKCKGELRSGSGYAGETVLYCPNHGIQWEDSVQAIRNVF